MDELKLVKLYSLNFIITNESIRIKLSINIYFIEFSLINHNIKVTSTNFNVDTQKLYNFIQWLSINYIHISKPKFLKLFYYETIIKGTTFLQNMKDCDIDINLENKYLKNILIKLIV
jgi:hypothetical protein